MDFSEFKHLPIIIQAFKKHRFQSLDDEKRLQIEIEKVFTENSIPFTREVRLNQSDIIDFMVDKIGIEVKIKASPKEMYRQLMRYTEHEDVAMIILVTNRHTQLPRAINKKATHIINLGQAWL